MSLRTAVVGLGAMGRHHARLLAATPQAELVAACDARAERAREHAERWSCAALTSHEDLPEGLDAVVVAAPTSEHRAIAEPLLRRGIACLVEKPLAASLEDADALVDAAREGGGVLFVGHAERFNPALLAVRDRITEPVFVECDRLGVFPDRSLDVDVVLDLMIHDLDLLAWLTGSELIEVAAIGVRVLTPRVDIANARLVHASGCTSNVTASRVSAEITRKLRIFQPNDYLSIDLRAKVAQHVRLEAGEPRPEIQRETLRPPEPLPEPLALERDAFLRAVRGECAPAVSGADGRRALAAALRVVSAMDEQQRWREGLTGGRQAGAP